MKRTILFLIIKIFVIHLTSAQSGCYFLASYEDDSPNLFVTILSLNRDSTSEYILIQINDDIKIKDYCFGYWENNHDYVEVMSEEYFHADTSTRLSYRALCSTGDDVCFLYRAFYYHHHTTLSSPLYDGNFHQLSRLRLKTKDKRLLKNFLEIRLPEIKRNR